MHTCIQGGDLFLFTHLTVEVTGVRFIYLFLEFVICPLALFIDIVIGFLVICVPALLCFSRPWEVVLTSFLLLLSYATWLRERFLAIPNNSNTHTSFGAWSPVHARARRADRVAR